MKFVVEKFLLGTIISLILFAFNCGRNDPEAVSNNPATNLLAPLAVYSLNISEPSGIAYNSKDNTFLVVSDGNSDIYIIDSVGNVTGTIPTVSSDMEGITLSRDCDTIFVVEETNKLVTSYTDAGLRLSSFKIDVATNPKHALEGITTNTTNGHLIILNEKVPCMLLEFNETTEIWRKEINYTADISDVFFEETGNCLWVVSDESKKILKLAYDTSLISQWAINVTKAEGIAIAGNKIYIVSDAENKIYVFQKPN